MDRVPLNDPAHVEKSPAGGDGKLARRHSWAQDHKVALGSLVALATLGGGFWWRRRRRRRIQLEPMSDQWLREREYDAGQREHE